MMPALGLGTELPETGIMNQPPRSTNDKLLNKDLVIKAFLWYGLIESAVCMAAYFYVNYVNGWPLVPLASSGVTYRMATTMTLASIVFCQIGMVMNCRTVNYSVIKAGLFKNKRVVFGIVFEIVLLSAIIYTPILQEIFNTAPLGMKEWLFLICLPVPIVLVEELRKAVTRHLNKKAKVS
ncbi:Calcium-transporting ATPase 1 [bioreactor metagenome]|uniref:Calcium-transporting ATPase 1 n=1 Tax=bioreactor metagenome TaxID=1076179 RepID=A0A645H949_9ZZZZ